MASRRCARAGGFAPQRRLAASFRIGRDVGKPAFHLAFLTASQTPAATPPWLLPGGGRRLAGGARRAAQ
ncbi:MAG TPA: hypothetical protein VHR45_02385 [Thermoanaerobaculia bacterium]|nr:hypothetical protein [Thermoanaerobaculia bacterium]